MNAPRLVAHCFYCEKSLPEPGHSHLMQVTDATVAPAEQRWICVNCRAKPSRRKFPLVLVRA